MNQKDLLQKFIDLGIPRVKEWAELLEKSIYFTAREKAFFLIDFDKNTPEQFVKFIKVLEIGKKRAEQLEQDFPDEHKRLSKEAANAWQFMLERLEEYIVENQGKKDEVDLEALRKKMSTEL